MITFDRDKVREYFQYIVDRQTIYHKKEVLKEKKPWSDDPIFRKYKFCNVYRSQDSGSIPVIEALKCSSSINQLFGVLSYRYINNKELIKAGILPRTWEGFDKGKLIEDLDEWKSRGNTIFCPAYVVVAAKWPLHDSVFRIKHYQYAETLHRVHDEIPEINEILLQSDNKEAYKIIKTIQCYGEFLAYQIVLDLIILKYGILSDSDFITLGPGALAGLNVLLGGGGRVTYDYEYSFNEYEKILFDLKDMQYEFLDNEYWKSIAYEGSHEYPFLSVNDIQFNLCEFRKYHNYKTNTPGRRRLFDGG